MTESPIFEQASPVDDGGPITAVLIDLWETLVPFPVELKQEAFRATAEVLGTLPESLRDLWVSTRQLREAMALRAYLGMLNDQLGGNWSDQQIETAMAVRRASHSKAFARVRPEAVPAFRTLRKMGIKLGLVSNCTSDIPDMLNNSELAGWFDATAFSFEVGALKPNRAIYLAGANSLGVSPSHCLYVGDGSDHELEGARSAGLRPVLLEIDEEREWSGERLPSLSLLPEYLVRVSMDAPIGLR